MIGPFINVPRSPFMQIGRRDVKNSNANLSTSGGEFSADVFGGRDGVVRQMICYRLPKRLHICLIGLIFWNMQQD